MQRCLWTAGQGMIAQQMNVDVISNNLANVNTTGFKKERLEFKDMLYETLSKAYYSETGSKPVALQIGLGVSPIATVKSYTTGNFEKTDNKLDFGLDGEGFFTVKGPKDDTVFTKDGSFKLSMGAEGQKITTSEGYPLLDSDGAEIVLDNVNLEDLSISTAGDLSFFNKDTGVVDSLNKKVGIVKFTNKYGLESVGNNFLKATSASGEPIADADLGNKTTLNQGYLESSNVQVVEEMVKLIVAQRAYEINSKSIQTADEMLSTANNLKK